MRLDKARTLIEADIDDEDVEWNSPLGEAYKLSFEALKRIMENRRDGGTFGVPLLPGETE